MRADRLLAIMLLLQSQQKLTAAQLADALEVSSRTILRDIDALSAAGVPVYAEGGHGGGISLDAKYRTTLTGLKDAEIRALFVSSGSQLLQDVGLGDAADSTLLKLFAALPTPHQPAVDHIRQRIHIDPLWWWHDTQPRPFWDALQQAVYEDRCITAVYETYSGDVSERVLEPYSLVAKSSLWYLIARRQGTLRTYRVSRFHAVTLLDTHFERDPAFDLPSYWQVHLAEFRDNLTDYPFTLRVSPERLGFAQWLTPGQCEIIHTGDDGWVTARFQMQSQELAAMLVFGLGMDAEVIDPPELADTVLQKARALVDNEQANERG